MSSYGETSQAWKLRDKLRLFKLEEVMATPFRSDIMQNEYFLLDSIPELESELHNWFERTY